AYHEVAFAKCLEWRAADPMLKLRLCALLRQLCKSVHQAIPCRKTLTCPANEALLRTKLAAALKLVLVGDEWNLGRITGRRARSRERRIPRSAGSDFRRSGQLIRSVSACPSRGPSARRSRG